MGSKNFPLVCFIILMVMNLSFIYFDGFHFLNGVSIFVAFILLWQWWDRREL